MLSPFSLADLLHFLENEQARGIIAPSTSLAYGIAARAVFSVLTDVEQADLAPHVDLAIAKFERAPDEHLSTVTIDTYAKRARKAVEHFQSWRSGESAATSRTGTVAEVIYGAPSASSGSSTGYSTAFPIRAGRVVTLGNIPLDLTAAEAERLAEFIRLLAIA